MGALVLPAVYTLVIWWASTALIVFFDLLPPRTFPWTFGGLSLALLGSLAGVYATRDDTSITGVYIAFACGMVAWGWQIAGFYMGIITGPRRSACPADARGMRRFRYGVGVVLYHEIATVGVGILILLLTGTGKNAFALWSYEVLCVMHLLAKLNVFFGVRNLSEAFVPMHARYLCSYFRRRPMNEIFPLSITLATILMVVLAQQALAAGAPAYAVAGYTMLTTIVALGALELWLLVVPIPLPLWDWVVTLTARYGAGGAAVRPESAPGDAR